MLEKGVLIEQQQFQIRELYGSKALPSKGLTFLKETSDRWNGAKSFRIWNCWIEQGLHQELLQQQGAYWALHQQQQAAV